MFLHAARCGIFDMHWDVLCPQSGMVLESFGALRTLKTHYGCGLCDVSGATDLDDFIEVTFSVSPQFRRLSFHDPGSLSADDFHWNLRFSSAGRLPGLPVRFVDHLRRKVRGMTFLAPGATTNVQADLGHGAVSGANVQTHAAFILPIVGDPATMSTRIRIRYDGERFRAEQPSVQPGPAVIEVENTGQARGSLLLINWSPEDVGTTSKPPLEFDPFLSGKAHMERVGDAEYAQSWLVRSL